MKETFFFKPLTGSDREQRNKWVSEIGAKLVFQFNVSSRQFNIFTTSLNFLVLMFFLQTREKIF